MRGVLKITIVVLVASSLFFIDGQEPIPASASWIEPGARLVLAKELRYKDSTGQLGVVNAAGPVETAGNPFFEAIGSNSRACVSCHQPSNSMSLSTTAVRERWTATGGKDPIFLAIDGSNNPALPQDKESSHSLLLKRGLFRVGLPWPPALNPNPEFSIEVVKDPTGVNRDPKWGLTSPRPTISVFRRPRPAANLKYVLAPDETGFNVKRGTLLDRDPDTGLPESMNLMADARAGTLRIQAESAYHDHQEGVKGLTKEQVARITGFESQIYVAQIWDIDGGDLVVPGGPPGLGPVNVSGDPGTLLSNAAHPVFRSFEMWKRDDATAFRQSVARGADVFNKRSFWVRNVAHFTSIGTGNPAKRTCSTCHNTVMAGNDHAPGWMDLGTSNYPTWTEATVGESEPDLPVFKLTCRNDARPHPYLGRVIYTSDPGRALITGRCADIGSITAEQLRGLAARAPYFSNGSAKNLMEVVDYYDRRFDIGLTAQEKQDLVNFLRVL
jgi:hypothetical protein